MRTKTSALVPSAVVLLTALALPLLAVACSNSQAEGVAESTSAPRTAASITDAPLAPYQTELLDLAFEAASAFPLDPHIKNRSLAQEVVVKTCFELDQPRRAISYIEQIENWRRGAGYAEYAFYCAQHGANDEVQRYLDLANQVAEYDDDENTQDWPRDRIRVRIAQTHAWMGDAARAAEFEAGVADSEAGKVRAVRSMRLEPEDFDAELEAFGAVMATGNFDLMRNALEACAQLFDRFYTDVERRGRVEELMKSSWTKMPSPLRVELTMTLIGSALDHGDPSKALTLLDEAHVIMDNARWVPEHQIPLKARLAGLRHRAGETEKARDEADTARAMFDAQRDQIVNIYRAEALRPLAETYYTMGDTAAALKVYAEAVEESVVNPNSRPRAQDLVATCCSLARHAIEPDAELLARIREIRAALGPPW